MISSFAFLESSNLCFFDISYRAFVGSVKRYLIFIICVYKCVFVLLV